MLCKLDILTKVAILLLAFLAFPVVQYPKLFSKGKWLSVWDLSVNINTVEFSFNGPCTVQRKTPYDMRGLKNDRIK